MCGASLLRSLLSDRGSVTTHDELSRALWNMLDLDVVQACFRQVVKLAVSTSSKDGDYAKRPLLLSLLDVLDLILSKDTLLSEVVRTIDTESLEALIHLMSPKDIRIDQAGAFLNDSLSTTDSYSDTPPANNLSRLDERSVCIEREEEEKPTTGIDQFIRISVATVLSRIGYFDNRHQNGDNRPENREEMGNGLRIIQSRIRAAVTEFFSTSTIEDFGDETNSNSTFSFSVLASSSIELTRRRFRLLVTMSVPENEEFLSSYIFSKDKGSENAVAVLNTKIQRYREQLKAAAEREARLIKDQEKCRKQMDAQSVRFWRETQRLKKSAAEETKSKVSVFDAERRIAEYRALEMSKRLAESEQRLQEADRCAKASHEAEARVRQELENEAEKSELAEKEAEDLKRTVEQREATIAECRGELEHARARASRLECDQGKTLKMLADRDNDTAALQAAKDAIEDNLNHLFNDLVALCQMYEVKESEEKKMVENNENLTRKLKDERSRFEQSERALQR
jgi:hypothetical protein